MLIIHPMWVIDEYAIMARNCLWFIPMTPPINAFSLAITEINILSLFQQKNKRVVRGPSFCQDERIRHGIQFIEAITDVYQK